MVQVELSSLVSLLSVPIGLMRQWEGADDGATARSECRLWVP